ncbi:Corticotropin-releasing factor-binding protein [Papilio machaon]|uniref:Corticotropin-releasing factor-binding protein n=1 Tax=Papilio machaon TaxID=76193 RepID=A0A194RNT3_PAPMA|nr:Corticotropin-releasing factor-binding protein [Papilio machaon]
MSHNACKGYLCPLALTGGRRRPVGGMDYPVINNDKELSWFPRVRRMPEPNHRVINPSDDCFLVTSDEGEIFFKSSSDEPSVCGIYMIADPDKKIQVTFNYLDVPCENGGLVAWVDGWELNGQLWPADDWNDERLVESCDKRPQQKLTSSQNAALIQYRVPAKGKGFAITVHHLKNSKPLMVFEPNGVYTLRNHGEAGNCSVLAIAPSTVGVLSLDVGQTIKSSPLNLETGTIHFCKKRGLTDYVDIGGSSGLDYTNMEVIDSICGLDSVAGQLPAFIVCESTVVRLVSSGLYKNSVTIAFSPLVLEHIEDADMICVPSVKK